MKTYTYKVYDASDNFLTEWTDVINEPFFSEEINTAGSELVLVLGRKPDDYDEGVSVKFGNVVKIYIDDAEADAQLFYQGEIVNYTPIFGQDERVEVTLYSLGYKLDKIIYRIADNQDQIQETGDSEYFFSDNAPVAQSFIPDAETMNSVDVKISVSEPRNVTLGIHTDSSGSPSVNAIAGSSVTTLVTATEATVTRFRFEEPLSLSLLTTYWIVLQT